MIRTGGREDGQHDDRTEDEQASVERLATEIRRGVGQVVSQSPAEGEDPDAPSARAWTNAERYVVPSVEPGASLSFLKKAILRVLRVATRSQGTFNAKIIEGARALERSLAATSRRLDVELARLQRDHEILQARMGMYESVDRARSIPAPPVAGAISEGLYARLEESFRGSEDAIRERQRSYCEWFRGVPGFVLDCGCGRGEFVGLLTDAGIAARGVDANRITVALARDRGLAVTAGDVFACLQAARGGLGGIAAIQFVEHLEPGAVRDFLGLAYEALVPGGRLLVETINPDSAYAMRAYRLDPTHRWPVPAPTLSLFARDAGFVESQIRFLSPVPPDEALAETGENERKLNRWIFGFQDYALFAERPPA